MIVQKLLEGLTLKDLEDKALELLEPVRFKFDDIENDSDFSSFVNVRSAYGATKPARRNGRSQGEFLHA